MSITDKSSPNPAKSARRAKLLTILIVGVGLAIGGAFAGRLLIDPNDERERSGVLMQITSKLGDPAPEFTLTDSDGLAHRVAPGGGTPHVLFFHMGTR